MSCWARNGSMDMYYSTNAGLKPLAIDDSDLVEALDVFAGDLTCCRPPVPELFSKCPISVATGRDRFSRPLLDARRGSAFGIAPEWSGLETLISTQAASATRTRSRAIAKH